MDDQILDTRGLSCPLPVLKARKRLKTLPDGSVLRILATDPKAPGDFVALCEATGHEIKSISATDDGHTITLIARKT